jgi:hypothetical protein
MATTSDPALAHACPHVDRNDPRCQERFRMGELDAMFRYCLGGYHGCVLFHRINREAHYGNAASLPGAGLQPMTVHGRAPGLRRGDS